MDIISSIDRFINNRLYHYALLINGSWGSGKTYFIKNTLIPHITSSGKSVNYLSLYGIKSTDEISQILCLQAIKNRMPVLETKGGQIATKVLSSVFKGGMNVIGAGDTGIEGIAELIPNYDNNVIIFDDLERCGCDINEVLGYINNFVEHSDAAVILVANEEEIGKWQYDRNPELQMMIAMDPRVKVDLKPTGLEIIKDAASMNRTGTQAEQQMQEFTIDEIERRRKEIFNSNEAYKRIKEKVIGLTINYEPNLGIIFRTLVENDITTQPLRDELLYLIETLVELAVKDNHRNLRTFQYFLEKVSSIYDVIEGDYAELHTNIIRYTYRTSIRYMKGLELPPWDADYGNQDFETERTFFGDQEFGFRFIDDLIINNFLDVDYMQDVLDRCRNAVIKKGQLTSDPYRKINDWWVSEDDVVIGWLDEIEDNIKKGIYSTELYTDLIRHLAEMKSNNVMVERCNRIYQAMQDYIGTHEPSEIEDLEYEHFVLTDETGIIYRGMHKHIDELIREKKKETELQKYKATIEDREHWAQKLNQASSNNGNFQGHSFVYWLEPGELLELIDSSNNDQLLHFRMALQALYDQHVFYEHKKDDAEHLRALFDGITSMNTDNWGQVKKAYKGWLQRDIKQYLNRIDPNGVTVSGTVRLPQAR